MKLFLGFLKKEIIALLRDPVLLVAVLVMPAVQLVVLSGAITLEANNLRLAVDAAPNDVVMARIYDHAIGSGWFVRAPETDKGPVAAVQSGVADVALIAPQDGLTRAMARSEGRIQVLIDSVNILKAQSIEAYLRGVMSGGMREMDWSAHAPVAFNTCILFNPQLNTKWFMVPSLMAILVFLSLLILITISMTKEKESGTIETLISAPITKYDIILGKVLPYIIVSFLIMLSILGIGVALFQIPFVGAGLMLILAFVVFSVPVSAIAVLLSNYAKTQQQALLGVVIVAFLLLMLSGAMIPTENMPRLLQYISHVNPLTHYAYTLRNILLKGSDWIYFAKRAAIMLGVGGIISVFAIRTFKTTL